MVNKQSKGETLVIPFPEYPRPALRRDSFLNLNGLWSYAITADEALPHAWDDAARQVATRGFPSQHTHPMAMLYLRIMIGLRVEELQMLKFTVVLR